MTEAALSADPQSDQMLLPAERRPRSLAPWWLVSVLLFFYVLSMVDRTVITMLVVPIQKDLHLSDVQIGLILGPAFAVSYSVAGFPLGWAADRFSRRRLVLCGVACWSLATITSGLSRGIGALLGSRAVIGIGEASLTPSAYSMIADSFPRSRLTTALAVYGMGPGIGRGVALAGGGLAIGLTTRLGVIDLPLLGPTPPWAFTFLLLGLVGLPCSLLVLTFREPRRLGRGQGSTTGRTRLLPHLRKEWRIMVPLMLGFCLMPMASSALESWVPTYMTRHYHFGPERYGPVLGLVTMFSAGTVLLKGIAVDWLFVRGMKDAHIRFYTWLLAPSVPALIIAFLIDSPIAFLLLYGLVNLIAFNAIVFLSATLQMIVPNELRGQTSAIGLFFVNVVASSLAPPAVAVLVQYVFRDPQQLGAAIAIVSVGALAAALVCLRLALAPLRNVIEAQEARQ